MLICLLFSNFCIFLASGQCPDDQQALLLQLKNNLIFLNFSTKLAEWNQSVDCCSWEGVTCNKGRVIGLNLNSKSISGGLYNSSSLFKLQYLQNLSLTHNDLIGDPIPSEFDKLTNLIYLNLSNDGFARQIPIAISRLTRLVTLDLSAHEFFYDMPLLQLENPNLNMLVQNLSELVELYLDGVNISSQGYEWGPALSSSLPKLRVLSMSNCILSGPLDSSLVNLQYLSIIRLGSNDFFAPVPELFADFKNLMSLDFKFPSLNGKFPKKIFQISTLQTLDLSGNKLLQGSLPELPSNGSLRILVLSETNFSGTLPHSIGNMKMLSIIDLSGCNFNGSIPKSMASLTKLIYLDMSNNNFVGSIPSFSMSKNLTTIDLSNNGLTGHITSIRWEELLNLEVLDLSYNSLEGSIPNSLFSLPSLQKLQLFNNRFFGQITEFSTISSSLLDTLDLSHNNLEGPIPMSIFELQSLERLSLSQNNFNGSLQLTVTPTMRHLSDLDLSHNSLVIEYNGTNSSLLAFPQIAILSLASNKLKTFPHFLINQSTLVDLDLSNNQIHGEIPNSIWKLPHLSSLNLSYNYLETLDFHLLNMSFVSSLDLHSNQLQGQLSIFPEHAEYLDLSGNNFSSIIPANIGHFLITPTYFFSLSSNELYGSIPRSICNATMLLVLDLSDNFLSGTFPNAYFS
jgi:Leucine-rich repeat (LRR) protein